MVKWLIAKNVSRLGSSEGTCSGRAIILIKKHSSVVAQSSYFSHLCRFCKAYNVKLKRTRVGSSQFLQMVFSWMQSLFSAVQSRDKPEINQERLARPPTSCQESLQSRHPWDRPPPPLKLNAGAFGIRKIWKPIRQGQICMVILCYFFVFLIC